MRSKVGAGAPENFTFAPIERFLRSGVRGVGVSGSRLRVWQYGLGILDVGLNV